MYTTTLLAAAAALASTTTALPSLNRRTDCSTNPFPWYINTQPDTSCSASGTPQITSGPAPGRNATCETLQGSWGALGVSIDGADCGNPFDLVFYTTTDCSDNGTSVTTTPGCLGSPPDTTFVAFSATHL